MNQPKPDPVVENVKTMSALHERAEGNKTRHQRVAELITAVAARPLTLYIIVVFTILWAMGNTLAARSGMIPPDPPPFAWLQTATSVSALLLTIVILATQRRQAGLAEQRAHLDLQVNLLAEQKVAKVIALLEELRRDLPAVRNRRDSQAMAMAEPADPHAVAEALRDEDGIMRGKRG